MVYKIARVGDKGDHTGCVIITGDETRIVNDRKIARVGDLVNCKQKDSSGKPHGINKIIAQSAVIVVTGDRKTSHLVSLTRCGAKIVTGSEDVVIDRTPDQESK